jgi:serine/threonine-protein kinase
LGVIAPSSAAKYKNSKKGLKEIAHELGVGFLLEGTIRWDKSGGSSRVRITPRLIEVSDNTLLWAENYERGIDAIFEVQIDIATQIVFALNITLLRPEEEVIESGQTDNQDAYQAYLRGLDYLMSPDYLENNFRMAVEMFQRATEFDSTYAMAYARLSYAHLALYHQGMDRTDSRRQLAKQAVDRALELEPELGEAHLALGLYYYWGHRDYDMALDCFNNARRILPNSGEVAQAIAAVYRRLGDFSKAAEQFKRAFELNPRDAAYAWEIGYTLRWLRRYEEAMYYIDLSIGIAPDQASAYELKRDIYLAWQGNIDSARIAQEQIPTSGEGPIALSWYVLKMLERDWRSAIDYLNKYEDTILYGQTAYMPVTLLKGLAYRNMEILDTARLMFDSARVMLERKSEEDPDDYRYHQALATTYAGLGLSDSAIKEIERALELFPLTRDAFFGTKLIEKEARVYCMLGNFERAVDRLDYLLSIPSGVSVALLKIDPAWDPLRDHPHFQALIEKYDTNN